MFLVFRVCTLGAELLGHMVTLFNMLTRYPTVSQGGRSILHSLQGCTRVPASPHLQRRWFPSVRFIMAVVLGVKRCLTVVLISILLRTHSRFFAQSNVTSFLSFLKWLHPFGAKVDPYFSRSGLGLISCHSSSPFLCSGYWAHDGIVFVYPLGSLYPLNGSAICPLCSVPLLLCIFWVNFLRGHKDYCELFNLNLFRLILTDF